MTKQEQEDMKFLLEMAIANLGRDNFDRSDMNEALKEHPSKYALWKKMGFGNKCKTCGDETDNEWECDKCRDY